MDTNRLDRIHISDLSLRCIIGINPDERRQKQDVGINLTLYTNTRSAAASDSMTDTVDYKAVKKQIMRLVETSSFQLIETLVQRIADSCLSHPHVQAVRVRVDKPGALRFARTVGVEIYREKGDPTP